MDHPTEAQSVEIYDGANLLAAVPANIFRQDLIDGGLSYGKLGFNYATPGSLRDGKPHWIMVKIAGTDYVLQDPKALTCSNHNGQ